MADKGKYKLVIAGQEMDFNTIESVDTLSDSPMYLIESNEVDEIFEDVCIIRDRALVDFNYVWEMEYRDCGWIGNERSNGRILYTEKFNADLKVTDYVFHEYDPDFVKQELIHWLASMLKSLYEDIRENSIIDERIHFSEWKEKGYG